MSSDLPIFIGVEASLSGQTLASSATGTSVDVREASHIAIQPVASGSSILGSVQMQGSLDNSNWGNIGSAINIASANLIPVDLSSFAGIPYMRANFTNASGVGSLTLNISKKR